MGYRRPELVATPEWLVENIGRPGHQVLDVRWRPDGTGRQVYAGGHIPGATYLDWRTDLVETDDISDVPLLAGPRQVTAALAQAGLGNGMVGILYDDAAGAYAARVWWSLRVYGFHSARILVGGIEAWRALGQPISAALELRLPTTFTPRMEPRLRLTAAEIRDLLAAPEVQLIDTRAPSEFAGHTGTTRRLGHIPGAINVPAAATTAPKTGWFRSADELWTLLRRAGVSPKRRLVCYDSTGVGACKMAFVLALLGQEDVAVYDGGWAEWGERLDLPLER
jgi:thiosulfate/3-mercaptopyruvate sulfurtransferase